MPELKGSRGASSRNGLVHGSHVTPLPTREVLYVCARRHRFEVAFLIDAEIPAAWGCKCGADAHTDEPGAWRSDRPDSRPVKTHWDQLVERRTFDELEELLNEALRGRAALREQVLPTSIAPKPKRSDRVVARSA